MIASTPIVKVGDEPRPLRSPAPSTKKSRGTVTTGRFAVLNAFLDFTLRDLDRAAAFVWLLLYRDTKPDGVARTSQADLARRAGVDVRTVRRATRTLVGRGLLTVVHRGSLRSGLSTYRVHPLDRPP